MGRSCGMNRSRRGDEGGAFFLCVCARRCCRNHETVQPFRTVKRMRQMNHELWSVICWRQHWLALHLVGGRADCVPQDAVLLLQTGDLRVLVLQLLPRLLELRDRETLVGVRCQSRPRKHPPCYFVVRCQFLYSSVWIWDWNLKENEQGERLTFICMAWSSWALAWKLPSSFSNAARCSLNMASTRPVFCFSTWSSCSTNTGRC